MDRFSASGGELCLRGGDQMVLDYGCAQRMGRRTVGTLSLGNASYERIRLRAKGGQKGTDIFKSCLEKGSACYRDDTVAEPG